MPPIPDPQIVSSRHSLVERQRMQWDAFVLVVVAFTAFEMPYDWIVGWSDPRVPAALDVTLAVIFGLDMVLNAITVRRESFGGFWGWRNIAGLVGPELGPEREQERAGRDPRLLTAPGEVLRGYFRSGWFLVDLLSTIPWGLLGSGLQLFIGLRLVRLLRITRLFRFFRLSKGIVLLERFRRLAAGVPSIERLAVILVAVPWLAHLHACLLCFFERASSREEVTYSSALRSIFTAFTTQDQPGGELSEGAFWVVVSAVCLSLVFVSALTGTMAALFTGLELRPRRRPPVRLTGHTVLLGWNHAVLAIIEQLIRMGRDGRAADIVVLADLPAADLWKCIEDSGLVIPPGRLTVLQGSVHSAKDIAATNLRQARQVIVFGDEDVQVLKALLACQQASTGPDFGGLRGGQRLPVVGAVHCSETASVLSRAFGQLGGPLSFHVVDTSDIVARCVAQVVGDAALAEVFTELFSYGEEELGGGSAELYLVEPEPLGRPFHEYLFACDSAYPIGFRKVLTSEDGSGSRIVLNPLRDGNPDGHGYVLKAGDQLIVIARSTAGLVWRPEAVELSPFVAREIVTPPRTILLTGCGPKSRQVLRLLPEFLPADSIVYSDLGLSAEDGGSMRVLPLRGPACTGRSTPPSGLVGDVMLECLACETVVVVAEEENRVSHDADLLMALTTLSAKRPSGSRRAVIELHDRRNLQLAGVFAVTTAVVSSELVSNYLVQLATDPNRGEAFRDLLDPDGSEIYLRPAARYLALRESGVSFMDVQQRARVLGEIAVGYAVSAPVDGRTLFLCPVAEERVRRLGEGDSIVVVAEQALGTSRNPLSTPASTDRSPSPTR